MLHENKPWGPFWNHRNGESLEKHNAVNESKKGEEGRGERKSLR